MVFFPLFSVCCQPGSSSIPKHNDILNYIFTQAPCVVPVPNMRYAKGENPKFASSMMPYSQVVDDMENGKFTGNPLPKDQDWFRQHSPYLDCRKK